MGYGQISTSFNHVPDKAKADQRVNDTNKTGSAKYIQSRSGRIYSEAVVPML